jgi:hypothetical protein
VTTSVVLISGKGFPVSLVSIKTSSSLHSRSKATACRRMRERSMVGVVDDVGIGKAALTALTMASQLYPGPESCSS